MTVTAARWAAWTGPFLARFSMAVTVFLAVWFSAVVGAPAFAQEPSPPAEMASQIAVIDVQAVLRNSQAARSIQQQIDARRDAYQSEVTEEEKALREAEQTLAAQRAVLEPDAYEQEARAFQDRVAEVQRTVQARKRALDEAFARAMNEVRQRMVATVAKVAEERGYLVVLFKNQIVIAAKSLDISEEVQARLDETLPEVDVDLPALE